MITEILQYVLGSRTEQCPECSDYVMLKEWEKVSVKENSFLFKLTTYLAKFTYCNYF